MMVFWVKQVGTATTEIWVVLANDLTVPFNCSLPVALGPDRLSGSGGSNFTDQYIAVRNVILGAERKGIKERR
jgi:hypothetical protein